MLVVAGAIVLGMIATNRPKPAVLDAGPLRLVEVARVATGHQRAGRLTFFDGGERLAVACPRYNRVVLYRLDASGEPTRTADLALDGRPVALAAASDRLYVLQRPAGDARHVEPGFWETYSFDGRRVGDKFRVGFDPDDIILTRDGRHALVLLSGHAEGETNRPAPELVSVALGDSPAIVGRVAFDGARDDPERITLSSRGTHAAVVLAGADEVAGIGLDDPEKPVLTGRIPLARLAAPYPSTRGSDTILVPVASAGQAVAFDLPGYASADRPGRFLATTRPDDSGVEVRHATRRKTLGRLPLRGPGALTSVRPVEVAYSPERNLIAVAERSGGLHLIRVELSDGPALLAGARP